MTADNAKTKNEEFVFAEIKARLVHQTSAAQAIDSKSSFVLASASVMFVVGERILSSLRDKETSASWSIDILGAHATLADLLIFCLSLSYGLTILNALWAFWPRSWEIVPEPSVMYEESWHQSLEDTRHAYVHQLIRTYHSNQLQIESKEFRLKMALKFIALEAAVVFLTSLALVWI
jgi:hypothetical protein